MINKLANRHSGSTVAIIGSAPSVSMYGGGYGVDVAVNGAALLGRKFTYFLYGDKNSHNRSWFTVNCSQIRIGARIVASYDKILYPPDLYPNLDRLSVPSHHQKKVLHIPNPIEPHLLFNYKWYKPNRLSLKNNFLMHCGTISCCACQLAYIMGASELHLYGCSFTHEHGSYFYNDKHKGSIRSTQIEVMDSLLGELIKKGIIIRIFGPTKLTRFTSNE